MSPSAVSPVQVGDDMDVETFWLLDEEGNMDINYQTAVFS